LVEDINQKLKTHRLPKRRNQKGWGKEQKTNTHTHMHAFKHENIIHINLDRHDEGAEQTTYYNKYHGKESDQMEVSLLHHKH